MEWEAFRPLTRCRTYTPFRSSEEWQNPGKGTAGNKGGISNLMVPVPVTEKSNGTSTVFTSLAFNRQLTDFERLLASDVDSEKGIFSKLYKILQEVHNTGLLDYQRKWQGDLGKELTGAQWSSI